MDEARLNRAPRRATSHVGRPCGNVRYSENKKAVIADRYGGERGANSRYSGAIHSAALCRVIVRSSQLSGSHTLGIFGEETRRHVNRV